MVLNKEIVIKLIVNKCKRIFVLNGGIYYVEGV